MANEEHLKKLKEGADSWNKWISDRDSAYISTGVDILWPDLKEADLPGFDFEGYSLLRANFAYAELKGAKFRNSSLIGTNFFKANLVEADFLGTHCAPVGYTGYRPEEGVQDPIYAVDFRYANLTAANFHGANLSELLLSYTIFVDTDLSDASLERADLEYCNFTSASLRSANLRRTILLDTVLSNTDLSGAIGIDDIWHKGPSTLDHRSIQKTSPPLPDDFLRGCGLSDWQIASTQLYQPDLSPEVINDIGYKVIRLRGERPIQLNPVFISYSHADSAFVDRIEKEFDASGIRFWRDIHDTTSGRLDRQIDRAISLNSTVFLVLSKHSVESDWVEWEVGKARALEKKKKQDVLCPVALDDAWKNSGWDPVLRKQIEKYNILDFSNWEDDESFVKQYEKLRKGLRLFYQGETDNLA